MALPAAQIQQALAAHERVKRSTEIPLFFGKADKDTLKPQFLIDRVDHAGQIAGWDDARKAEEFYMILRDRALIWYDSLEMIPGVNRADWPTLKAQFLAAYAPKNTAKTNCSNFAEMIQKSNESVQDYYLRIMETFRNMCQAKPAAILNVRAPDADPRAAVKLEGIQDMEKFFLHQLFLAGLKEEVRGKVMEGNRDELHECVSLAREIEVIQNDRKTQKGVTVASIEKSENSEPRQEQPEGLEDDEIEAINAIRFKKGKRPFTKKGNFGYQGNSDWNKKGLICFYCKKPNHIQKNCKTRIRNKAPMVNSRGEPYTPRVSAVEERVPEGDKQKDVGVDLYRLSTIGAHSLNF